MYLKDQVTNEKLVKQHSMTSFDLVNHAIRLAKNMAEVEREPRIKTPGIINSSYLILEEIAAGQDAFEEPQPRRASFEAKTEESEGDEKKPRRKLLKTLRTTKPQSEDTEI